MTFSESIRTCFTKYADFNGCASRSEYWWWVLFILLVIAGLTLVNESLGVIFNLAILLPTIAVTARRLHDTDRSGWLQLVGLIPLIGLVVLFWYAQEGKQPNRYSATSAGS